MSGFNANSYDKPRGPEQEALEVGSYPARLVQLILLGVQKQEPYKGEAKPPVNKLYITWELPEEFIKDEDGNEVLDKPRWISEEFPLHGMGSDLAKSTKRYLALDPKREHGGDWSELVGAAATIDIAVNAGKGKNEGRVFNNIMGASPIRSKAANSLAGLVNPPKLFDLDSPDMEVFGSIPTWLQDKIKENLNFAGSTLEAALNGSGGVGADTSSDTTEKGSTEASDDNEDW